MVLWLNIALLVMCLVRNLVHPTRLPAVVAVFSLQLLHSVLADPGYGGHIYFGSAVLADMLAIVCLYVLGSLSGASSFLVSVMRINCAAMAATIIFYVAWFLGADLGQPMSILAPAMHMAGINHEPPPLYVLVVIGLLVWQAVRMMRITDDDRRDMASAGAHFLDGLGFPFRLWTPAKKRKA